MYQVTIFQKYSFFSFLNVITVHYKAHYKLNRRAPVYSDLLSLEVCKDELLNRITEGKLARVKPARDVSVERTHRHEVSFIKIVYMYNYCS